MTTSESKNSNSAKAASPKKMKKIFTILAIVIIVLVVALGVITPPVGMNVFIIQGVVKDLQVETIFKGVWPFVLALFACIAILIIFPQLVAFLPALVS